MGTNMLSNCANFFGDIFETDFLQKMRETYQLNESELFSNEQPDFVLMEKLYAIVPNKELRESLISKV